MSAELPALLDVRAATKVYKKGREEVRALDGVDLAIGVEPATITTLAGESGSGKTTLADAILGFTRLTSGEIYFRGQEIQRLGKRQALDYRREVQAIFQDPFGVYNPFYRIRYVFDVAIRRFELARTKREADAMIEEALSVVGMRGEEVLDKQDRKSVV